MPVSSPALRALPVAIAAIALLAGCDRPKPHGPAGPAGPLNGAAAPAAAPAAPAPPPVATSTDPLPATPGWAQADMGKTLKDVFPGESADCLGNTDAVNLRYQGATPGVRIEGWGWDRAGKKAVQHVLLVDDKTGAIVGAGETGKPRPDVTRARPEVASPTTGWQATTARTTGGLYAFGIVGDGKTTCRLGHINL